MSGNVSLAGPMGSGKTTVAGLLAARLGRAAVDTDDEIERWVGRSVAEIFEVDGEAAFRGLERRVVRELAVLDDLVLSLGGGVVLSDDNVADLTLTGAIVELRAPVPVLIERLASDPGRVRPLIADDPVGRVAELAVERSDRYAEIADVTVNADQPPEQVVEDILDWLRDHPTLLTPSEYEVIIP